jgi:lipopolysaccharide export system permease protein
MNLLNRYIILEFIKCFSLVLFSVVALFVVIDYLGNMDEFIAAQISMWRAFQCVLYKVPFICTQALPVILLLSILIVFGLMSKNNELIIINSSGISIYALVKPVLWICIALAAVQFAMAEQIVPATIRTANIIKYQEIRKTANVTRHEKNIWIKGHRQITHIKFYHPPSKAIFGFTRYYFDSDFRLVKRLDAEKGVYVKDRWQLSDCMTQTLNPTSNAYRITFDAMITAALEFKPQDFKQIVPKSQEMNFRELREYAQKVKQEGYDATVYTVDMHAKTAYPVVCILMGLIGIGLTARRQLRSGLPTSIMYGLTIGFLFWIFQSFCLSLGYGEILSPPVAAWAANAVFLCAGLMLVLQAE